MQETSDIDKINQTINNDGIPDNITNEEENNVNKIFGEENGDICNANDFFISEENSDGHSSDDDKFFSSSDIMTYADIKFRLSSGLVGKLYSSSDIMAYADIKFRLSSGLIGKFYF